MANSQKDLEDLMNRAANSPLFKKLSLIEMQNLQNGRIWEIKLNGQEETLFVQLESIHHIGNTHAGKFDVITNIFEVDEKGEAPTIENRTFTDSDIEGVFLTQMSV